MSTLSCPACGRLCDMDDGMFCPHCRQRLPMASSTAPGMEETAPRASEAARQDADPSPDEGMQPEPSVAARIEFKHLYLCAGQHGCIPFRITNLSERPITRISLSVDSSAFHCCDGPLVHEGGVLLQYGHSTETRHCDFAVAPVGGRYGVQVSGWLVTDDEHLSAFRGSFSLILRDPHAQKPAIIIEDGAAGCIEEIDMEAVGSIVVRDGAAGDIGRVVGGSPASSPSNWIALNAEKDLVQTQVLNEWRRRREGADNFSPEGGFGAFTPPPMALLAHENNGCRKTTLLCGSKCCRLGRHRPDVDLTCMLLPATEENASANRRISRRHCLLRVVNDQVFVEDVGSRNGTWVDRRRIDTAQPLDGRHVISLGKVLSLGYQEFKRVDETREVGRLLRGCRTDLDCSRALSAIDLEQVRRRAPLEAFRLRRINNFGDRLEYLCILKSALIGSADDAAVNIPLETVAAHHARLRVRDGRYFIEDLDSPDGTHLDGERLPPYRPVRLGAETELRLGRVTVAFRILQ